MNLRQRPKVGELHDLSETHSPHRCLKRETCFKGESDTSSSPTVSPLGEVIPRSRRPDFTSAAGTRLLAGSYILRCSRCQATFDHPPSICLATCSDSAAVSGRAPASTSP